MNESWTADALASLQREAMWRSTPEIAPATINLITRLLERGEISAISGGPMAQFERQFAAYCGVAYGCSTNNGTSAIYAGLSAVGVRAGDDVLVCDYGFHGMAAAVLALGARVVPVDCLADSWTMDPGDLAHARTPQTRALLVHNPWGVPAEYEALRQAADGLPIVADASHAHGATYREKPIAQWADVACYSFGHSKLISGGELGCAVTNDAALCDRMLIGGHVNRVPADVRTLSWSGNAVGLKLRPHLFAVVLALSQLRTFPARLENLRSVCRKIEAICSGYGLVPQQVPDRSERSYWKIVMRVEGTLSDLEKQLRAAGVPVEPNHYLVPLQRQPIFDWPDYARPLLRRACPVAEGLTPRLLTLPAPVTLPEEAWKNLTEALDRWNGNVRGAP